MAFPALVTSNNQLSYQNVILQNMGKRGVLKELDGGYYELILGAFSAFGNGDWLYDLKTAQRYIENDPEFVQTLTKGRLSGEWGHPVRTPGMTDQEWFIRINTVAENNICLHIRRIRLSMDTVKDERGRWVAAIIGEVRPSGKEASSFKDMLLNPHEDVNMSIRSFARKDFATHRKHITRIITWDNVRIPGIEVASKYNTPSMESRHDVAKLLDQAEFNIVQLRQGLVDGKARNDESFESLNQHILILDSMVKVPDPMPNYLRW